MKHIHTFESFLNEGIKNSDKEILSYYDELTQISKADWKDARINLGPLEDTISKFSHSGSDTTYIKNLIKKERPY
jgi:hypothetical protein